MGKDIEYEYEYFYQQARNTGYAIVNMYSSTVDINDAELLQAEKHMYYFYKTLNDIDEI